MSGWVDKYGRIVAYTTGVIILTAWFIHLDASFGRVRDDLQELRTEVQALQTFAQQQEKYERYRRAFNAKLHRVFNKLGWDYEDVE